MAVTAFFNPPGGTLFEFGDALDNTIITSRNAAGTILINGGAVAVSGGTPTVANTSVIQVFGQSGNDTLTLDESSGALPAANLFGDDGNDTLTGGSGADALFGQNGNDTLLGKGGFDFLFGGAGNDTLTGGDADDQLFGESGDDRMIWNPGDDTDLHEGGDGIDTSEVNGGNGAEVFTATANGTRVHFDRLDPAPFSIDIGTTEKLVLNMNGGNDSFSAIGDLASLIAIVVDGGAGNDTILGSNGADMLLGGEGDDTLNGGNNDDTLVGGAGTDTLNGEDGNDLIIADQGADFANGGDGNDAIGSGAANGITAFGGNGNDAIGTGAGNDTLNGGNHDDNIFAGAGADIVGGGLGTDWVGGGTGNDQIYGEGGLDFFNLIGDINAWDSDYLGDFNVGGTADYIALPAAYVGQVSYFQYASDVIGFVATGGASYYSFYVDGAAALSVAQVEAQTMYF